MLLERKRRKMHGKSSQKKNPYPNGGRGSWSSAVHSPAEAVQLPAGLVNQVVDTVLYVGQEAEEE
jgi:hypothetical protein